MSSVKGHKLELSFFTICTVVQQGYCFYFSSMSKEDTNDASKNRDKKTNGGTVIEAKSSLDALFRRKFQAFIALVTLVFILARAEVQY